MVHPLFIAEGYSPFFKEFEKHFHGKNYANGKAKLRMREVKFYCPSINEVGYEEFLSDIKSFCGYTETNIKDIKKSMKEKKSYINADQTGQALHGKINFFAKLMRKFFPQIKDIKADLDKVECAGTRAKLGKQGKHFILNLHPIGKVADGIRNDGVEIV